MSEHAQEVPWGFERKPEDEPQPVEAQKAVWREHAVGITRSLWIMHGMVHRVLDVLGLVGLKARSIADRGPDDFGEAEDASAERLAERVARIIARRYGPPRHTVYNNGDAPSAGRGNGEKRLLTWILGVVGALLVGGVGGGIAMYGKLSSIEKGQDGHEQRINRLEADRDQQRYRGANAGAP